MMYLSYLHTNQQKKFKFSLGIGLEMGAVGGLRWKEFLKTHYRIEFTAFHVNSLATTTSHNSAPESS